MSASQSQKMAEDLNEVHDGVLFVMVAEAEPSSSEMERIIIKMDCTLKSHPAAFLYLFDVQMKHETGILQFDVVAESPYDF